MARNGSGTYVPPTGNPVSSGTTITSSWANTTITDVGNEITNSLPRDGQAPMTATLKIIDGGSITPGIAFNSESATGLFRPSAGNAALTVAGVEAFRANSGGRLLVGTTIDDGTTRLQVNGNQSVSGTLTITGSTTANNFHSSGAVITGGSIDGAAIGATTASTGRFTTITATGTVTAPTFSGALTGAASLNVLKAGDTMTGSLTISTGGAATLTLNTAAGVGRYGLCQGSCGNLSRNGWSPPTSEFSPSASAGNFPRSRVLIATEFLSAPRSVFAEVQRYSDPSPSIL